MKYATFSANGATELRTNSSIELPAGGVLLTDDQFDMIASGQYSINADGVISLVPAEQRRAF